MKLFLGFLLVTFIFFGSTLSEVRKKFEQASKSKEETISFYNALHSYKGKDATMLAYQGASEMLYSRYFGAKETRKKLLISGSSKIDAAIQSEPSNAEIRLIRFIIQENLPKVIAYNRNLTEDKKSILNLYSQQTKEVKILIKKYSQHSKGFTASEKEKFN
ncbi:hypothetical protein [Weeksella sp. HMSC059D05]|uniref:hypothetical protein n=1 Tax=Weeksella sp. HMSC059D05 TaxID=1715139 RepID=UPI0008A41886|nr:hypothetical protein [Weeksella sp. HMSC059D05]OFM83277.1 hypothetical protein HMPREF2660_01845 [Weeksella sp. HMSC059D05]